MVRSNTPPEKPIRAPRGTRLHTRGWSQEGALRMLMNNLDPAVAEKPAELPEIHCVQEVRLEVPLERLAELQEFYAELLGLTPKVA